MRRRKNRKRVMTQFCIMFLFLFLLGTANAMQFDLGEDTTIDLDITLKYTAAWRLNDAEASKLSNPNADDGNLNFDEGDMINNKVSALIDIDIQHKNLGVFIRPKLFNDFVYTGDNANYAASSLTRNSIPGAVDEFPDGTEDRHGKDAEILDLFAYGSFNIFNRPLDLRVGRQVISWGESLFIPNGISSAQSHLDGTIANAPGVELKELFLPTEAVYGQFSLTNTISVGAYYQWKWRKTRIDESGSYFAVDDFLDESGSILYIDTPGGPMALPRGGDVEADDDGQYGFNVTYLAEWLGATEFAVYYLNYHEKNPMLNINTMSIPGPPFVVPTDYSLSYAEDVKLYGISFSSNIGGVNASGEISYREDYMALVGPVGASSYEKADVLQVQISCTYTQPFFFIDNLVIAGEAGFNEVSGTKTDLTYDEFAWGYTIALTPTFYQALPALDVEIPLRFTGNPDGHSSIPKSFVEDADSFSIGLGLTYRNNWLMDLAYVGFLDKDTNDKYDRDYFSISLKRTF